MFYRSLAIFIVSALIGCSSVPPGMSAIKVAVLADPKVGVQHPVGPPSDEPNGQADPFALIDYRNLTDVVVYLEPVNPGSAVVSTPPPLPTVQINAGNSTGRQPSGVNVVSLGGDAILNNTTNQAGEFYFRSDSGEVTNVGRVDAHSSKRIYLNQVGPIALLRETGKADDDRIADFFVAPNSWVKQTVGGGTVTFSPVSPGQYAVTVWQPRLPGMTRQITVQADQSATVSLKVGVNSLK